MLTSEEAEEQTSQHDDGEQGGYEPEAAAEGGSATGASDRFEVAHG
jgi:hypothetical protein